MQIRFLLGPAGCGKTFRCLAEIRKELLKSPEGPPLILLAPKQATFQLERQLLGFAGGPETPPEPGPGSDTGSRASVSVPLSRDSAATGRSRHQERKTAGSGVRSPHPEEVQPLEGYTRLHILSFDRLADFILARTGGAPRDLLEEEGRVMALRALLGRNQSRLKIFHATARLPGFARQLNLLLREFQRQQVSAGRLAALADQVQARPALAGKLSDAARLLAAYEDWLRQHGLEDVDRLLDVASQALRESVRVPGSEFNVQRSTLRVAGLWLDGFAEMTPQELDLLAGLLPVCERATLAFCLDAAAGENASWLSRWSVVEHTYRQCRERAAALPDCEIIVEPLNRDPARSRFAGQPFLGRLEEAWANPDPPTTAEMRFTRSADKPGPELADSRLRSHAARFTPAGSPVRLVVCASPEAEAALAAREILRFVRSGGRLREAAVLVRRLDDYHETLRRVFARYEIPFFLDRREPVAHHPLAELTRSALRLAAFGWRHDDWFGALKTGLAAADDDAIDYLENEALARGWEGAAWFQPLKTPGDAALEKSINRWRERILPPFKAWDNALSAWQRRPTGRQLAAAVRRFWADLEVEQKLDQWTATALSGSGLPAAGFGLRVPGVGLPGSSSELRVSSSAHATVWDQMNGWLANVELAFGEEALALADWLPILEAGLANLSVGVIPPALDQVLIGAIDRSRNPELKLVVLPGWNETVFPALPEPGPLLTESERDALAGLNVRLGLSRRQQIGRERYYAYIACTRARQGVLVTRAARDADGQTLYPSPFFDQLKRLAGVGEETFPGVEEWRDSEHACELAAPLLRALAAPDPDPELMRLAELPAFAPLVRQWREWEASAGHPRLAPAVAESLYGRELHSSVSGLEGFAACPFKFFAARGLRLQERKEFQVDARDQGSFQHEVLREFHQRIQKSGRRWRDLDAAEARDLVCAIGHELLPVYGGGRFRAAAAARFAGEFLIERLGRLVTTLIEWMPQYGFDPERAEVSFGLEEGGLPAWKLALPGNRALLLRGRMDRVDLCREGDGPALAVVVDYKSRARALNPTRLHHGLDLQLLSYLGALRQLSPTKPGFGAAKLLPVGAFYIPLNGGAGRPGTTRAEVLGGGDAARRAGYQHSGRFRADALSHLDNRDVRRGDQFRFWKREDGGWRATGNDAMPAAEFEVLREKIEDRLREFATRIYAGEMDVAPYRLGSETACDRCEFRAVCRFDPWTQPFRQLRPPPKPERASPLKSASHFQTNG